MSESTKFVAQYVGPALLFSGGAIGLGVYMDWEWWIIALIVGGILLLTLGKFVWDLSGFLGGYGS